MKVVIANDSYKGTLDQVEIADIVSNVFTKNGHHCVKKPMSDGGDGLLKCLDENYKTFTIPVTGVEGISVKATYKMFKDTAIIETAEACGLHLLSESLPGERTSYGVGELIIHALSKGAKTIILGLGGSATSDGGYGLFKALGGRAMDKEQKPILSLNKHIDLIEKLDGKNVIDMSSVDIIMASDVTNPLLGKQGAVQVFGPQKGITEDKLNLFEERIEVLHEKMIDAGYPDYKDHPGSGAAGGLGWMLLTLGAEIQDGGKLFSKLIRLEADISDADLVITGEGRSDSQTMEGKVPSIVLSLCQKFNVPCILLSGQISEDFNAEFYQTYSLVDEVYNAETVMMNTSYHLNRKTQQILKEFTE